MFLRTFDHPKSHGTLVWMLTCSDEANLTGDSTRMWSGTVLAVDEPGAQPLLIMTEALHRYESSLRRMAEETMPLF